MEIQQNLESFDPLEEEKDFISEQAFNDTEENSATSSIERISKVKILKDGKDFAENNPRFDDLLRIIDECERNNKINLDRLKIFTETIAFNEIPLWKLVVANEVSSKTLKNVIFDELKLYKERIKNDIYRHTLNSAFSKVVSQLKKLKLKIENMEARENRLSYNIWKAIKSNNLLCIAFLIFSSSSHTSQSFSKHLAYSVTYFLIAKMFGIIWALVFFGLRKHFASH
ncbi:unnamed protein product [Blepharisma stoltei]|uniref:Uncharacterized protein n=1 Tax=Blepharisma stoltei TaxID=1481888 RepID=A0AAU9IR63_9CILI|nr:unnamed protein product [Blepharisma stoltei]